MATSGTDVLEVPTIYKAYFLGLCKGISRQNMDLYGAVPPLQDPEFPISIRWCPPVTTWFTTTTNYKILYICHKPKFLELQTNLANELGHRLVYNLYPDPANTTKMGKLQKWWGKTQCLSVLHNNRFISTKLYIQLVPSIRINYIYIQSIIGVKYKLRLVFVDYPLVNVYITMKNHHAINGKTHYFDWAMFENIHWILSSGKLVE